MNKKKIILEKTGKDTLGFKEGTIEDLVEVAFPKVEFPKTISKIPKKWEWDIAYVICPDLKCNGFYEDNMQCIQMSDTYRSMCPHKDEAYRIHIDYWGHHIKVDINKSQWQRLSCNICETQTFQSGNQYWRISTEMYEDYIKEHKEIKQG
jgi:hypothetical protein